MKLYISFSIIILTGCCTKIKVPPPPLACNLGSYIGSADQCTPPPVIPTSTTYADSLIILNEDRGVREKCYSEKKYLVEMIKKCDDALDKYSKEIEEINIKYGK